MSRRKLGKAGTGAGRPDLTDGRVKILKYASRLAWVRVRI